jgi:23S rRNA (cytidine1920-2'-O)/16S rRNA (cytidine1409-2'-O)-methyltransferase
MHVTLPEPVSLVVIDVAWTKQKHILPNARKLLADGGEVITLLKPHYEAEKGQLKMGVLREEELPGVVERVTGEMAAAGFEVKGITTSPIKGAKGNVELLAWLRPA